MKIKWPAGEKKININKEHAKKYLMKYIKELQLHFDMTEKEIKDIIMEVYYTKTSLYRMMKKMKKILRKKNEN